MSAVRLALFDVRNVDFDDGNINCADAVGQGNGSVGIASRIHHHGIILIISLLQLVDKATLVVRLIVGNLMLRKGFDEFGMVVFKGHRAIDFGLAFAQQIEVWAVENEYFHLETFLQR